MVQSNKFASRKNVGLLHVRVVQTVLNQNMGWTAIHAVIKHTQRLVIMAMRLDHFMVMVILADAQATLTLRGNLL